MHTSVHVLDRLIGVVRLFVLDIGEAAGELWVESIGQHLYALHRSIDGEDLRDMLLVNIACQPSNMNLCWARCRTAWLSATR